MRQLIFFPRLLLRNNNGSGDDIKTSAAATLQNMRDIHYATNNYVYVFITNKINRTMDDK
jgi:hypothetical protein